jgi:hypothetical protein
VKDDDDDVFKGDDVFVGNSPRVSVCRLEQQLKIQRKNMREKY